MRRLIGLSACISVLAFAGAAHAQTADPETAQFMCDLTGDCAESAPDAAVAPSTPAPVSGARTSATRGFSFKRATTAEAEKPARPAQVASIGAAPRAAARPAVGSADLKLSFMPGSAILTEDAKARLAKYAAALNNARLATRRVRIEGHTDASGSARANQSLSQRRAQAVADYLVSQGLPRGRFDVVGLGSSRPLAGVPAQSPANRRVMAVLL
jgi:outer membrane protein OmpA-like peptidoglycan-associated protein